MINEKSKLFGYSLDKCVTLDLIPESLRPATPTQNSFPYLDNTTRICSGTVEGDRFILVSNGEKERVLYKDGKIAEMSKDNERKGSFRISVGRYSIFSSFDALQSVILKNLLTS